MYSTLFAASLLAASAIAKPLVHENLHQKRDYFTVTDVQTVYATVTGSADSGSNWGWWGGWHHSSDSTSIEAIASSTAVVSSTQAPVPVVTETPLTTQAWTSMAVASSPIQTVAPVVSSSSAVESAWSTSVSVVATSTGSSPSQGTGPGGVDIGATLEQHNNHRLNASVPSLTWSTEMASIAAEIAASCTYAHNTAAGGGGYGQNIGAGAPPQDVPAMITNEMYNGEINSYPLPYGIEPDMSNFEAWGHYSQIVWKDTVSVGCAVQDCSAQGLSGVGSGVSAYFTVCNYSPPGRASRLSFQS